MQDCLFDHFKPLAPASVSFWYYWLIQITDLLFAFNLIPDKRVKKSGTRTASYVSPAAHRAPSSSVCRQPAWHHRSGCCISAWQGQYPTKIFITFSARFSAFFKFFLGPRSKWIGRIGHVSQTKTEKSTKSRADIIVFAAIKTQFYLYFWSTGVHMVQ